MSESHLSEGWRVRGTKRTAHRAMQMLLEMKTLLLFVYLLSKILEVLRLHLSALWLRVSLSV